MPKTLVRFYSFPCLLILLLLINWPSFNPHFVPVQDAMNTFNMFYYFYNEFFTHGHLAQWSPFNAMGQPAHYTQILSMTPLSYFFTLMGTILHIKDVLWVFKISLLA